MAKNSSNNVGSWLKAVRYGVAAYLALFLIQDITCDKYPLLNVIPETNFSCYLRSSGYYADDGNDTRCQVYHMCNPGGRKYSYLCPNHTLFNQDKLICDHWYRVNCTDIENRYKINELLFANDVKTRPQKKETSPRTRGTPPPNHQTAAPRTRGTPLLDHRTTEAARIRGTPLSNHQTTAPRSRLLSFSNAQTTTAPRNREPQFSNLDTTTAPRTRVLSFSNLDTTTASRTRVLSFSNSQTTREPPFSNHDTISAPRTRELPFSNHDTTTAPRSREQLFANHQNTTAPRTREPPFTNHQTTTAPRTTETTVANHSASKFNTDTMNVNQISFVIKKRCAGCLEHFMLDTFTCSPCVVPR